MFYVYSCCLFAAVADAQGMMGLAVRNRIASAHLSLRPTAAQPPAALSYMNCNFEYLRILRCMRCLRVRLHIACCGSQLPHWSVARCCRGLDAATPKPYFITFLLLYVEAVAQTCGRGVTERGGDSSKTSRGCHSCPVSCSSAPVGPAAAVQQRATHFTVVTDPKSPHP